MLFFRSGPGPRSVIADSDGSSRDAESPRAQQGMQWFAHSVVIATWSYGGEPAGQEFLMKYSGYKYLILSDLYRITGNVKLTALIRHVLFGHSYKYNFWMRTCRYTRANPLLKYTIYPIAWIMLARLTYKLGILIPPCTEIGSGFYIGHFGGIVVNGNSVIGKNCNISPGVILGQANRGKNKGYPTLGNNVYIGPGAKIVGAVKIGNNVAIGANCVVTTNVPDNSVVVGVPGKVISREGAAEYVNGTDYDDKIS